MNLKRIILSTAFALTLCLCAAPPALCALQKDSLILALESVGAAGFDPCRGWGRYGAPLFQSTLLTLEEGMSLGNDLATEYGVSEDGLVWTFTIRGDVKFSDGTPLRASDVAFTLNQTKQALSNIDLSLMGRADALDDTTVRVVLNKPVSGFPYVVARLGIVPEHAYDENYGSMPIGSGPYKVIQFDKGQQVIAVPNEHYYGTKPKFKQLTMLFMTPDAAFAALKKGTLDVAMVTEPLAVNKVPGFRLVVVPSYDNRGIAFPMLPPTDEVSEKGYRIGNAVTSDIAIRKALNLGLSRQKLNEDALNGLARPIFSNCDGLPWQNKETTIEDGQVDKAIALLEAARWVDGDGDGIREKDGLKAEFTLIYAAKDQTRQIIALAAAEQAKALGIHMIPTGMSWEDAAVQSHAEACVLGGGLIDRLDMYKYFKTTYKTDGWINATYYSNPKVDEYLEASQTALTDEKANLLMQKAQWDGQTGFSLLGDANWCWLVAAQHLYFVRDGIDIGRQKFHGHGQGFPLLANITEWDYPKQ